MVASIGNALHFGCSPAHNAFPQDCSVVSSPSPHYRVREPAWLGLEALGENLRQQCFGLKFQANSQLRSQFFSEINQGVTISQYYTYSKDIWLSVRLNPVVSTSITSMCVSADAGRQPEKPNRYFFFFTEKDIKLQNNLCAYNLVAIKLKIMQTKHLRQLRILLVLGSLFP